MPEDNEQFAELFAEFFYKAIVMAGGSRYTAHRCVAEWWRAVDEAVLPKNNPRMEAQQ